jgi:hypothetical protein
MDDQTAKPAPSKRARKALPLDASKPPTVTLAEYGGLQIAYTHFNRTLFDGELPEVLIDYQRHAGMRGHFYADRFVDRGNGARTHELALHPDGFVDRTDKEILSTLVHEQVHHWQQLKGTAPKRPYHDKEWAAKMRSVGLQPLSTGMVGGKETGASMTHYIVEGGPFDVSYEQLRATGWKLNLQSTPVRNTTKPPVSKAKFTCPRCSRNVWGKPDTLMDCRRCGVGMESDTNRGCS